MDPKELYSFYTQKKEEAEKAALNTVDEQLRSRWLAIAEGYRILASGHKGGFRSARDPFKSRT